MRTCIFIDGENFRHSLKGLFYDRRPAYLPPQADWKEFFDHLAGLIPNAALVRTYWYVVDQLLFSPGQEHLTIAELKQIIAEYGTKDFKRLLNFPNPDQYLKWVLDDFASDKKKMIARFAGWRSAQDSIARKTDYVEFRRSGVIRYSLFDGEFGSEKAVDVKLAVDLLELRHVYETAIIVSGDQDYVPAVQVIKDLGKKAINVVFRNRRGDLLPGGDRSLNIKCDKTITVYYTDMERFIILQ